MRYDPDRPDADLLWERVGGTGARESRADLILRARSLMAEVARRTETSISVVAHSSLLLTLFNAVLELRPADAALGAWFRTGEMRSVSIFFD